SASVSQDLRHLRRVLAQSHDQQGDRGQTQQRTQVCGLPQPPQARMEQFQSHPRRPFQEGSTRYFSARARDSSVKGPCPRVSALPVLRRSPKARFTWRTSMPGSPSTATCPSKAERTSAVPKAFPREYQVGDPHYLQSRDIERKRRSLSL